MCGRGCGPSETSLRGCGEDGALHTGECGGRQGTFEGRIVGGVEDDLGLLALASPLVLCNVLSQRTPYSTEIRVSPELTVCPASTRTSETVPAFWERTSLSIFIASRMHTGSSAETSCPSSTSTLTMVPCIGAAMAPPLAEALRVPPCLRRGGPPAEAPSSPNTFTLKSLPFTSTSTSRASFGDASAVSEGGVVRISR